MSYRGVYVVLRTIRRTAVTGERELRIHPSRRHALGSEHLARQPIESVHGAGQIGLANERDGR